MEKGWATICYAAQEFSKKGNKRPETPEEKKARKKETPAKNYSSRRVGACRYERKTNYFQDMLLQLQMLQDL